MFKAAFFTAVENDLIPLTEAVKGSEVRRDR